MESRSCSSSGAINISAPLDRALVMARYPQCLPMVSMTNALLKEVAVSRMESTDSRITLRAVSTPRQ